MNNVTQIRLQIFFPHHYQHQPILSKLVSDCALTFNITEVRLGLHCEWGGKLDLELRGTIEQIRRGLTYLDSLNLKIVGKPNPDRDGWYC